MSFTQTDSQEGRRTGSEEGRGGACKERILSHGNSWKERSEPRSKEREEKDTRPNMKDYKRKEGGDGRKAGKGMCQERETREQETT